MTNRILLSGGSSCSTEMVGGKRRKYHKKSMKRHGTRKSRRHSRKMMKKGGSRKSRGAGMVQRAALPFGLLALQKMMHRRKSRKSFKKFGKKVLKTPYKTAKFLL